METGQIKKEHISAWLDGELPDADPNVMMAALDSVEGRACWDAYHRIGDCLRSDELDLTPSADFSRKLAQGLAAEPHWLVAADQAATRPAPRFKSWIWPGAAVAASLLVVLALPHAPVGDATRNTLTTQVAPTLPQAQLVGTQSLGKTPGAQATGAAGPASGPVLEGELLRDPQIDQYLMAHQRFSPSGYSAAHYASPNGRQNANRKTGTDK
jgi:sigma-E factor negative regulatory protein RseA